MNIPVSTPPHISASKRSLSHESSRSAEEPSTIEHPIERNYRVPAFLRQSKLEIYCKFEELEWLQQIRIAQGRSDSGPQSQWVQEASFEIKSRNRYRDVQPWANNRIHLKVPECRCDYINASPISLRNSKTGREERYIATQGPTKASLSHIWHMVWQETTDVAVIVMLTQISESGHEKCFQYFPADTMDNMLVSNEEDEFKAQIQLLELTADESKRITTRKLLMTVEDESRTIWHLSFSGWPDFGVPEGGDRSALFELLRMSTEKNGLPENPRIVHCSAGVGRSGTFIALDHLIRELDSGAVATAEDDEDMIFNTVNGLREQRMMMVQSDAQYLFLYEVLKNRFEGEQAIVVPSPLSMDASMETTQSSSEGSPKVARLAKAADAVTVDYSGKQHETVSVVPVSSS